MGKTKEILSKSKDGVLKVELVVQEENNREILHIQTDKWRLELTKFEFGEIVAAISEANIKLKLIKDDRKIQ